MRQVTDLLITLGMWFLPRVLLQRYIGRVDFAFIIHPRDARDIARKFPWVRLLPGSLVSWFFDKLGPMPVSQITGLVSKNGLPLKGWQIAVPSTAARLLRNRDRARKRILRAICLAEKTGAKVVGLGALTASLTEGGRQVASHKLSCKVTTGHSFTVATVITTAKKAADIRGISFQRATIAIVGACGSIGSACARWLASENVHCLILNDCNEKGLEKLRESLAGQSSTKIQTCAELRGISQADIVLVATNDPRLIIQPHHLKHGCIVIDDAQPPNVSPVIVNGNNRALLAWGGLMSVPGINLHFDTGVVGRHTIFSCLAECLVLSAYDINESYTIGPVDITKAKHLLPLASRLGISLPPLQAFGKEAAVEE